jgi:hypothetical protein
VLHIAIERTASASEWTKAITGVLSYVNPPTFVFLNHEPDQKNTKIIDPATESGPLIALEVFETTKRYFVVVPNVYSGQVVPKPFLLPAPPQADAIPSIIRKRLDMFWSDRGRSDADQPSYEPPPQNDPATRFNGERMITVLPQAPLFTHPVYDFVFGTTISVTLNADEMTAAKGYNAPLVKKSTVMSGADQGEELRDCLRATEAETILDSKNLWHCSRCDAKVCARKSELIWSLPPLLIVHLNRFMPSSPVKNDRLVKYPEELDMSPFVKAPEKANLYHLIGVVEHHGKGIASGHYEAIALHHQLGQWFRYNDTQCFAVSPQDAHTKDAYILFYERTE